jgi:putative toxin-antitoxin system antitoxin component (TIGR02293 family)
MDLKSNSEEKLNQALHTYLGQEGLLNEPSPSYGLGNFLQDKLLLIEAIQKGISFSLFEHIQKLVPLHDEEWADFLNVSLKTLQRNRKLSNFHFKPIHSEKIFELAEVSQLGLQVFDSPNHFRTWLNTPNLALANHLPKNLLQNSYGKELVMDELNRINHGIFA